MVILAGLWVQPHVALEWGVRVEFERLARSRPVPGGAHRIGL